MNKKDTDRLLNRFYTVRANLSDWVSFKRSIEGINAVSTIISKYEGVPIFEKIRDGMNESLGQISKQIGSIIDFTESKSRSNISIRRGVNEDLDALNLQLEGMDELLSELARMDVASEEIPSIITEMSYTYFPQLGYLMKIPYTERTTPSLQSGSLGDLSFRFKADDFVYYKNRGTQQLDEEFGDIQGIMSDTEAAIMRELTEETVILGF